MTASTIEMWPTTKPVPYARNARIIPDSAVGKVAASIKEFGFKQPIVVDGEGVIIAGHTRLLAAERLGLDKVPVLVADDLTPAQVKAYRLADNRTGQEATWDMELLGIELEDLAGLDIDLSLTGFDAEELLDLQGDAGREVVEDEVPEPPEEPITKPGDLWLLGEHRVLCGDSSDAAAVALLMNGKHASLMATDPPYGVAYGDETGTGSKFGTIANDENDGPRLQAFLESVFSAWLPSLQEDAAWYLWHAQMTQGFFAAAAAAAAAVLIHRQIIWVKPSLVLGHGDYHWQHELCFYGWREGSRCPWYGDRSQTTVWAIGRENDHVHPTQKPVELFARPMQFNTRQGDVCAEPFAGSGTQFIAAEQTGRICYGMEIDPRYCDVIVTRWENLTGKQATLA